MKKSMLIFVLPLAFMLAIPVMVAAEDAEDAAALKTGCIKTTSNVVNTDQCVVPGQCALYKILGKKSMEDLCSAAVEAKSNLPGDRRTGKSDVGQMPTSAAIREKLRADSEVKTLKTNIKANETVRANLIKNQSAAQRTNGTTTILKAIRKDIFERQKSHLIGQLNRSLANLAQIRERVVARMQKAELSGRSMALASSSLKTADIKLNEARIAVNALSGLFPVPAITASSTVATTTASTTAASRELIDAIRPRQAGTAAIKAVNEAKKALNSVVVAIAHSMGLKVGRDGRIAAPEQSPTETSTATTSPTVSATSTATTTP